MANSFMPVVGYPASAMGPQLHAYVEQELTDLERYGVSTPGLSFDLVQLMQERTADELPRRISPGTKAPLARLPCSS